MNEVHSVITVNEKYAAVVTESSSQILDSGDAKPKEVKKGYRGFVPWGDDNDMPDLILEKIRKDEVMSSNMFFNVLCGYGAGFDYRKENGEKETDKEVKKFFRHNRMGKFFLEENTDLKHFFFSVPVIILSNDGKKIVQVRHKEAQYSRFETCNPKTGKIEHVFFANWSKNPKEEDIEAIPLLDEDDPYGDLLIRMGIEPGPDGKKGKATDDRKFAIPVRIPTPGNKYYPFAYYYSHFNSGWYDIKTMIPSAKKAKMVNGMVIKYQVEIHKEYWTNLFTEEQISDPEKKKSRKKKEYENIKTFLSGVENQGKVWFSTYYIDPNGKEQKMVRITVLDKGKEGGDYIEDTEEASNIGCYAQSVHPSLIGATPGKAKGSFSGSDKRELFTMKQALERAFRDMLLEVFELIRDFNKWPEDLVFDIPDLMLTTLDEGTDAKTATSKPQETEEE